MHTHKSKRGFAAVLAMAVTFTFCLGVAQAAPKRTEQDLVKQSKETLEVFKKTDKGTSTLMEEAVGYAVFPNIAKGGFIAGGAGGTGVLFEKGVPTGTVSMTQVSVGAQIGGQNFSEVIFFEDDATLTRFKTGQLSFGAQASAVAAREGAATSAPFEGGVKVFTIAKNGLMLEASIGGQKFSFTPMSKEKVGALLP